MSVNNLKQYLIDNPEEIIRVLELTDFYSISFFDNKRQIRCAYYEGGNPTSVSVDCETLSAHVFSTGLSGDIFNLIAAKNSWNLGKTITTVAKILRN